MYCPECKCEYVGWKGRCPVCKAVLLRKKPTIVEIAEHTIPYDELVDLVKERGGYISIDLSTTSVGMKQGTRFPYLGRGYAWMKQMQSAEMRFPYLGYGYAWVGEMSGKCGDQFKVELSIIEVDKERKWKFPYFGYGFAWASKGTLKLALD